MKKIITKLSIPAVALIIIIASVVSVFGATVYVVDGYSYTISDNNNIALVDWDTSIDTTLALPDKLSNRYFADISNWAFEHRTDLQGLDLSKAYHLQRIGYETFIGCSEITNDLVLPNSVTTINDRAFSGCSSIPSITIKGRVTVIPVECFYGCASAKTVVLPNTVQTIGSWAFGNCTALEYVEIPKSVTNIAASAFLNDPNLILGVYKDTVGHQYAVENKIDHIVLDGYGLGDVNFDGVVDILDGTEIQKYAAESTDFTTEQYELGDINKDGYCDVIDALLVQKSVIGAYELPPIVIRY